MFSAAEYNIYKINKFFVVFEPDASDENEYKIVFEDFKNLVDFMLGNFMDDIGITPEQFEEACNKGNQDSIPVHFDQVRNRFLTPK